jgi:hypothetical protein
VIFIISSFQIQALRKFVKITFTFMMQSVDLDSPHTRNENTGISYFWKNGTTKLQVADFCFGMSLLL